MLLNPVEFFAKYIESETGITYNETNHYQLKMRLEDFCRTEKLSSVEVLFNLFQSKPIDNRIKQKLLDMATNNETSFFRDPRYFEAMEKYILETILPNDPKEIKIWSAAASTGQEAISIAIVLDELSRKYPLPPFKVFATDISHKALDKCKSGIYTDFEVCRGLSDQRRQMFFEKFGEKWKVKTSLLNHIHYSFNNLIRSSVFEKFHLIFCRNVLIYQKTDVKLTVLDMLFKQLEKDGALLMGAGETLVGLISDVEIETIHGVSFYKKIKSHKLHIA